MSNFWEKFFNWLERVLPSAIAAFGLGHKLGVKNKEEVESKLEKAEYELKKAQNELRVREKYDGKSAKEIIEDYLNNLPKR